MIFKKFFFLYTGCLFFLVDKDIIKQRFMMFVTRCIANTMNLKKLKRYVLECREQQ